MVKILVVSDDGVPTGYGRISSETNIRLTRRGHQILAASLTYDGLLPAQFDGQQLPYHVASLQGKNWVECVVNLINAWQPDIVHVIQDAPYAEALRNAPIDWSRFAFMVTTPVDGAPIRSAWVEIVGKSDAALSISEFGVDAYRKAGVQVGLCRPGINLDKFYRLPDDKRAELRAKMGIEPGAFVLGAMCMHQGRKSIPQMLRAFFDFAQDKPSARILMDMDAISPAGWDLPDMCKQFGWDANKIIWRIDAQRAGVMDLRERYNVLDAHAVLAFREGYGLPIPEAMACGVVSIAQDWCAGTEVLKDGRGILIPPIDYFMPSTWGNALDKLPDYRVMTEKLQWLFDNPAEREAMAKRGMEWARHQTWDAATDAVQVAIEKALAKRQNRAPIQVVQAPAPLPTAAPQTSPDGVVKAVELVEQAG